MKNAMVQFFKMTLIATLISACSFDKNDPSADRAKERENDRAKLVQQYAPAEGRYVGKLEFFDRPNQLAVDVELGLIMEEENSGVDSDGLPIARPALRAYFKRADDLSLGLMFKANYNTFIDPNNQNLILTNPTQIGDKTSAGGVDGSSQTTQEVTSIRGKLAGDTIEAQVLTGAGILGKLSLIRKDKSAEANSLGFQADINEKVLRLYNRVEGTYEGMVLVPGATLNPIHARVTLTATLNEKGKPVLKAFYERLDIYPITDYNQELNVDYKTESYPQKISLVSASGSGFNFSGTIYSAIEVKNRDCSNNFVDTECQFYLQGDLILSKNQKAAAKLVRIKDRYQAQDSAVLGRYRGTIKFSDRPQSNVTLNMSIFVQEEWGGADKNGQPIRRPVFKAYLQRSDMATGTVYAVSYNDIVGSDSYNLVIFPSSVAAVNGGAGAAMAGVAGATAATGTSDIVSLRGNFRKGIFSAELLSANGIVGKSDLKWIDKNTQAPSDGVGNQNNEALFKLLKQVEGTYTGSVDYNTSEVPVHTAKFKLTAIMTGVGKPVLRGYYTRSDDPTNDLSLDLDVDYKPETYPQRITMSTSGMAAAGGGGGSSSFGVGRTYFINVDGFLHPQNPNSKTNCSGKESAKLADCRPVIVGTLIAPKGRRAEVKLVKTTK
ncbi:MAG: hypothetical protein JNM24_11920 [Bdellovibrionaceae bacterium]|nr:hypothetical protein [Pseudobdellovibrionaceae bacterium]